MYSKYNMKKLFFEKKVIFMIKKKRIKISFVELISLQICDMQ